MSQLIKVAVVQAAPVILNCVATTEKVCRLIREAAEQGARLVLLPEAFISAYPRGLSFGTVVSSRTEAGRRAYARYWDESVDVPGSVTQALGEAAAQRTFTLLLVLLKERKSIVEGHFTAPCFTLGRMAKS